MEYVTKSGHEYQTGDRVCYVKLTYGDGVAFTDMKFEVDWADQGLITRVIDDWSVMVLWLNDHEVSDHHVSVITPYVKEE